MGGKAFSHTPPPLLTPRLPPPLYFSLRTYYITLLSSLFKHVSSPPPLPEKSDHGDIDILVASPIASVAKTLASTPPTSTSPANGVKAPFDLITQAVFALIKPHATVKSGGKTRSYAVPHPEKEGCFVQLDVMVCGDIDEWRWNVFLNSHGDLWVLWGKMLKGFGLVATDKGLWLRNITIEEAGAGKEKSRVFLTNDVTEVLSLLGYEGEDLVRYWGKDIVGDERNSRKEEDTGASDNDNGEAINDPTFVLNTFPESFPTLNALFRFAVKCRFFRKTLFKPQCPPSFENEGTADPSPSGEDSNRKEKKEAREGKGRGMQRDAYHLFVDSFLPGADATNADAKSNQIDTRSSLSLLEDSTFQIPDGAPSSLRTSSFLSARNDAAIDSSNSSLELEAQMGEKRRKERQVVLNEVLSRFDKRAEWEEMARKWDEEKKPWGDKAVANALKEEYFRRTNEYTEAWIREVCRGSGSGKEGGKKGKRKRGRENGTVGKDID